MVSMACCGGGPSPSPSLSLFSYSSNPLKHSSSSSNASFFPATKPSPRSPYLPLSRRRGMSSAAAAALSYPSSSSSHLLPCIRGYGTPNSIGSKSFGTKQNCRATRRVTEDDDDDDDDDEEEEDEDEEEGEDDDDDDEEEDEESEEEEGEVEEEEEEDEEKELEEEDYGDAVDGDADDEGVLFEDMDDGGREEEEGEEDEKYRFPDPIPQFAVSETAKFKGYMLAKLSKKQEIFKDSVEEVVDICTEIFSEFLHTEYGGPGTLLVNPFADMNDTINEVGLPGGPRAARAAVVWASKHVDKDWEEWTER